jgi:DNA-binding transcriptional ArsR family regulator
MARKTSPTPSDDEQQSLLLPTPGRFNYEGLERTFHERARLGIMTSLVTHSEGLSFNDLRELCSLSDGNLNRHIEVLRDAGYVRVEKTGGGRGAKSTCFATAHGAKMFQTYLSELERVIQDAAKVVARSTQKSAPRLRFS